MRGCGRKLCACAQGSAARGGLSARLLCLAFLVSLYFPFCGVSLPFCFLEHKHSGLGELHLALETQSNDEFHWKFYIMIESYINTFYSQSEEICTHQMSWFSNYFVLGDITFPHST